IAIRGDLNGGAVGEKFLGDLLEILHVRSEDDRFAEHRRLENVVSALVYQAAADEDGGRQLVDLRELADGVEHDDVGAWFRVYRQLGSPRGDQTGVACEPLHFAEALRLARRE